MGGESSRTSCHNCRVCSGGNCDGCNHSSCVSCMNGHRNLRNLEDRFYYKVNDSKLYIKNKCVNEAKYLVDYYNIYIYYNDNGDYLNIARDILSEMKKKEIDIESEIISYDNKPYENYKFKALSNQHSENMLRIRNDFALKKGIIEKEYSNKLEEKNKKIFLEQRNELNIKKKDIENEINERKNKIEQYKSEERNRFENDFISKQKEINMKYPLKEVNISLIKEYTDDEKNEKNKYENMINEIKNYSKFIPPNFEKVFINNYSMIN